MGQPSRRWHRCRQQEARHCSPPDRWQESHPLPLASSPRSSSRLRSSRLSTTPRSSRWSTPTMSRPTRSSLCCLDKHDAIHSARGGGRSRGRGLWVAYEVCLFLFQVLEGLFDGAGLGVLAGSVKDGVKPLLELGRGGVKLGRPFLHLVPHGHKLLNHVGLHLLHTRLRILKLLQPRKRSSLLRAQRSLLLLPVVAVLGK